jgi:iron(III) transport system permease protein
MHAPAPPPPGRPRPPAGPRARAPGASPVLLALAALTAVVAVLPLAYLVVRSLENGWGTVAEVVLRERTLWLIVRSLGLAAVVTASSLAVGIGFAWLIVRTRLPGRRLWTVTAALPLAVPSYVAAFAWLSMLPGVNGFVGSALVLTLSCYPYVLLPVVAAFDRTDTGQEEVARSLGLGPLRTFLRVTLPQVQPAAGAGGLLVALYVLSDFGVVSLMRFDAFTRVIYTSYRASFDRTPAAILGCVLVVATILILWMEARARGRARHSRLGTGVRRHRSPLPLGPWTLPAVGACTAVIVAALGVPLSGLAYWLMRGTSGGLDVPVLTQAAGSTLALSGAGALLATLLALPVGILAARSTHRVAQLLERATWLSYALPGIVVALAMVFFSVRYVQPLYQEAPLLVLAYAVLFLPAAVGAVRAAVAQAPPVLDEVGRSLGVSRLGVFTRVTLPLTAPGIGAGTLLVFLLCMKELPATLLLRPTGMETMATRLWAHTSAGSFAAAAPYAALLIALAAVPAYLLGRRAGSEGGHP